MNLKKSTLLAVLFSTTFILISCSTAKLLPVDISDNAKNISPTQGKALIYIFRKSMLGGAVAMRVEMNKVNLASFFSNNFYLNAVKPGEYELICYAENKDNLIIRVEGGKKYYIEIVPQIGFGSARCKLKQVDIGEGEEKVRACKLIGLNQEAAMQLRYTQAPQ